MRNDSLLDLFEEHCKNLEIQVGKGVSRDTHQKYLRTGDRLRDFMNYKYRISDINLKEINHSFLCDFEIYLKVAKCTDANCGVVVFRNISEKQLSDGQITELLTKGKTAVIKGFKSKAGKTFDAALKFDKNYLVTYDFHAKKAEKGKK
jgi:hypothetical protein